MSAAYALPTHIGERLRSLADRIEEHEVSRFDASRELDDVRATIAHAVAMLHRLRSTSMSDDRARGTLDAVIMLLADRGDEVDR